MELESKLRDEYQGQLDVKTAEIESHLEAKQELQTKSDTRQQELQAKLDKQLEEITNLSKEATANKRTEQLNRELTQRSENLTEEVASQKKRIKSLQKDLAEERDELKALKQFDPAKMKKSLDANKKKLAEKTSANELLQKTAHKAKSEKAELQQQVKELEAKLEQFEEVDTAEEEAA
jgi:chromosome segregation ATPase